MIPGLPLYVFSQVEERVVSRIDSIVAQIDWEDPEGWETDVTMAQKAEL